MLSIDSYWMREHLAKCPRCRRTAARLGRVEWGLMLLYSQRQPADLLARANGAALQKMNRSSRFSPQAVEFNTQCYYSGWGRKKSRFSLPAVEFNTQ